MDKEFLKILKEFGEGIMNVRKKPYNFMGHADDPERELHHLYFQYKIFKWTRGLVFATWGLAIGTILILIFK